MLCRMAGQFPTLPPPVDSLLYFLFNSFCPKHTTEASGTLKPSERYSFKECSHRQSSDSLSPKDNEALRKSPPALEWGRTKTSVSKISMHFKNNGSFPLCSLFFPFQFQVCTLPAWPFLGLPTYHTSYKMGSLVIKAESTERQFLCTVSPTSGI